VLGESDRRAVRAGLLGPLRRARGGAFVTAPLLAERLLFACIEKGDEKHLDECVGVLRKHARGRHAGAHMKLVARLAEAVEGGKEDPAAVCEAAAEQGLSELAGFAAIAALARPDLPEREAKVVAAQAADAILAAKDRGLAQEWRRAVTARLPDHEAAAAAVARVFAGMPGGVAAAGGAGGAGRAGGAGGGPAQSALGRAWRRFPKRKPLASVERGKQLVVRHGFEKYERSYDIATGVKHVHHGGLTLKLNRTGVAPAMLDPTGRNGQPGDSSATGPFDLFHRLARPARRGNSPGPACGSVSADCSWPRGASARCERAGVGLGRQRRRSSVPAARSGRGQIV